MKNIFLSFSLILVLASLSLEPVLAAYPIVIGKSKFKKEDRDVKNFNGIAAGGPIDVVITLGTTESLRFEGDEDAIATLITEVKGNILMIRPKTSWTSWAHKYENKKITAYVSAKTIKSLTMSGNGKMSVKGTIQGSSLASTLSGSGSITASIDVDNFAGTISGSGSLNISGKADNATVTVSGSGSLTKKGLSVGSLSSVISGSGSVNVNAEDHIDAVVSGSGSINYSGNATVEQRVIGSGRVRKI
ncbi:head GIN domain-containing protein [Pedobacter frigiditerrae]|uniref:head GIN domain-containing protein n=1 Tax=Pedobacter frigiditerrae TaxID=2530452 RepID=UPI002931C194|nr:head GIN domain-containing protein [Pedobacter frigiditerrae]